MSLTVTHSCGHEQLTRVDELAARAVEKGTRTQEQADQFLKDQIAWFTSNLCPQCYTIAVEKNPWMKPVG